MNEFTWATIRHTRFSYFSMFSASTYPGDVSARITAKSSSDLPHHLKTASWVDYCRVLQRPQATTEP
jgi:hypothetical protein